MTQEKSMRGEDMCPPDCDWAKKGFYFEQELARLAIAVNKTSGQLDTLHEKVEVLVRANRAEMDILIHRYIDEMTKQVSSLASMVNINTTTLANHGASIRILQSHMAKHVAIWASIAGAVASGIMLIIQKLVGAL